MAFQEVKLVQRALVQPQKSCLSAKACGVALLVLKDDKHLKRCCSAGYQCLPCKGCFLKKDQSLEKQEQAEDSFCSSSIVHGRKIRQRGFLGVRSSQKLNQNQENRSNRRSQLMQSYWRSNWWDDRTSRTLFLHKVFLPGAFVDTAGQVPNRSEAWISAFLF